VRFDEARFLVGLVVVGDLDVTDFEAAGADVAGSEAAGADVAGLLEADFDVAGLLEADFDAAGLLEADFVDAALEVERFRTVRLAGGSALSAVGCGAVAADSGTVP